MNTFDESGQPCDDKSESSVNFDAGICEILASKYSDNDKLAEMAKKVDETLDKSVNQHGAAKVGMAVCLTGLLVSCCSAYMKSGATKNTFTKRPEQNKTNENSEVV
jgi:hypothetical protein